MNKKINKLGSGSQRIVREIFADWEDECLLRGTIEVLCKKTHCKCNRNTIKFLEKKGFLEKKIGSETYKIMYDEVF